ncbi:unnamed protein product [Spirodela intermedia]|uniref:Uncharacterized protein n=1 Tax=Spirodela intermedia TaxID=51605 RepID=A0A7I8KCC5_SPIIN|nr:unnamed protein product [Spirodela intermedia]
MQESTRFRDRGSKKDRDRDRSSRSKRRRGDRMLHGSNREEGEDSTDESIDEDEEDDGDVSGVAVRLPPPPPPFSNPSPPPLTLPTNHNPRKIFPSKVMRPPAVWKAADEMIGVSVPRKARSAPAKRPHECLPSGSGGGGGVSGEQMHRQASSSPSRQSQTAAAAAAVPPTSISPATSNASIRKKTKQIGGSKQRPPKISKSPSSIQEIEIEVAEVLYGLTRQFQDPSKTETQTPDSKDTNGSCNEMKSRASSPNCFSPPRATSQSSVLPLAPKRKRPRPVRYEDESPTSPPHPQSGVVSSASVSSTNKAAEGERPKMDVPSPKSVRAASSPAENGGAPPDSGSRPAAEAPTDVREESKPEDITVPDVKYPAAESEASVPSKEPAPLGLDVNDAAATMTKAVPADDHPREKFQIDLMAPPPGKSSPEMESDFIVDDSKPPAPDVERMPKAEFLKTEEGRYERAVKQETREVRREEKGDKSFLEGLDRERPVSKERPPDLHLDAEKGGDKARIGGSKQPGQRPLQQSKATRSESKPERAVQPGSVPLPMSMASWPGGLPFGYVGQVPSLQAVVPVDSGAAHSKTLQPPHFVPQHLRPRRCATHCYIAQNIYYQQLTRMNPFWSAAAGSAAPLYGAKPYNLNMMPGADSVALGSHLQGGFPGRGLGGLQDKAAGPMVGSIPGHPSKEKGSPASGLADAAQRKQLVLQQPLPAGASSNILPTPAFIFPINQTHGAHGAGVNRATPLSNMNPAPSSAAPAAAAAAGVSSGSVAAPTAAVGFNYANLPQGEAQYVVLQNHGYPFPIPAHVGAPQYRGGSHTQGVPFFNGSLYASQILHPSQLHQQQPQPPQPSQQNHQNASTSTSSSSSQKHSQKAAGDGASGAGGGSGTDVPALKQQRHHLPPHQARQIEGETGGGDSPSSVDSRISQAQKGIYGHNFVMPLHPQNFALMSTAVALSGGAANHNDKLQQHPPPHQQQGMKVELAPSQAFAMSFASFNGVAAAAAAAAAASGQHHALDFSSAAQNHAIFQSLPEAARHGYQVPSSAQAAGQHKKPQHQLPEGGKSLGESVNTGEEARKAMLAGKPSSRSSSIDGTNARVINIVGSMNGGSRAPNRPDAAAPSATGTSSAATGGSQHQQRQQHLLHLQKQQQHQQHQQQLQMQQQLASRGKPGGPGNNVAGAYSDRMPGGAAMSKLPNALSGIPQALIQGNNNPTQSGQWKNSARAGATAAMSTPAPNPNTPAAKNHLPQQQGRAPPQSILSNVGSQSQISFGINSGRPSPTGQHQQLGGTNSVPSSASAATAASVGSSPSSASKNVGGSPRGSSNGSKMGAPSTTLPLQQQPLSKSSGTGHGRKASSPSILGQPHMATSPSSIMKSQQQPQSPLQQQQNLQKQQPFPPPQIFFANSYLPAQSSHSNSAAAGGAAPGYHQRAPTSEQQQQQNQPPLSSASGGTLSLCPPSLTLAGSAATTSDPPKATATAAAAGPNSMKGLASPSILQAAHFASGSPQTLISAAGFPYFHGMSSVSVKPAEQKPAAVPDAATPSRPTIVGTRRSSPRASRRLGRCGLASAPCTVVVDEADHPLPTPPSPPVLESLGMTGRQKRSCVKAAATTRRPRRSQEAAAAGHHSQPYYIAGGAASLG